MERDKDGNEKTNMQKYVKPVLTRWETVGKASHVTHQMYLPTFCALQYIINMYCTKMYGMIAAEMQSLMKEPKVHSDLTLLNLFNRYHILIEMEWNRTMVDFTRPGFQSHHIAVWYPID
jgi:hypothetical protein